LCIFGLNHKKCMVMKFIKWMKILTGLLSDGYENEGY